MIRSLALITLLCLYSVILNATIRAWGWNIAGEGPDNAAGMHIATDAAGNIIVCGYFNSSLSLDTALRTGRGGKDGFIAKFSPQHQLLWILSAGSSGEDDVADVAVGTTGTIYLAGTFSDTLYLGSQQLVSYGGKDVFLASISSNGQLAWIRQGGGKNDDYSTGLALGDNGQLFLTGSFGDNRPSAPAPYGEASFGQVILPAASVANAFLVRYDTSGNARWARRAGIVSECHSSGVATNKIGNVYIAGEFLSSRMEFDSVLVLNSISTGLISGNGFTAKYDTSGNLNWANAVGGSGSGGGGYGGGTLGIVSGCYSLAADDSGNSYVFGSYTQCGLRAGSYTLPNTSSSNNSFRIKYSTAGVINWVRPIAQYGSATVNHMVFDKEGNCYTTGHYDGQVSFGNDTLNAYGNIYVAAWNSAGQEQWTATAGYGWVSALAVDSYKNVYITGSYTNPVINFGYNPLANTGKSDMFLAQLTTQTLKSPNLPSGGSLAVYPNPATKVFQVSMNGLHYSRLFVSDAKGVIVYERAIAASDSNFQINLEQLSSGIYYLNLSGKDTPASRQILLAH